MIAEFDECPECNHGPAVSVRVDRQSVIAVRLRCACGKVDAPIPLGVDVETLARAWNAHVSKEDE